ncbi:MAG TPA: ATP-dependent Clp protease ATP-binding subunit [Candidatus Eisenbacteria bacterium]|jgi:ATP-dependent Clp protease ATP-binding subunit ClpC
MDSLPLSASTEAVLSEATGESSRLGHHFVGVEHVFAALARADDLSLRQALDRRGVALDDFLALLMGSIEPLEHHPWGTEVLFTPRCRRIMSLATGIAIAQRKPVVTNHHLLEAILREGRSVPMRMLGSREVEAAELFEAIGPGEAARESPPEASELPLLDRFGRDLTRQARNGALTPVIGREAEIALVAEVLLRKRKNSPVLVGQAGVGKTAVVEGLARMLATADARHPLKDARIIELSMASLVAGTKYRGQFEERLLGVIQEASGSSSVVLFLDEIHTIVGTGSAGGDSVGAADIVKPALARGELRCIGATTLAEYRRHIERDAALERRFEPVMVEEPTPGQAREILAGVAPSLAEHHGVDIQPEAIEAALELTVRYVPQRRLPDKAIDALDQSGARLRLGLLAAGGGASRPRLGREAVACTVSQWTGIPLERLSGEDVQQLVRLEEELRRCVVGQDHACRAVARAILTARAGLADPERPVGVFLFLGPTGVGKTELARSLARLLYGGEKRLVRFDMSEYMEPHSVAKLIGAPPGYVGHEQEGLLVSALRTHPDCVVLFDEIEKAHPQVFDLFLQIFDEGRLGDAHGKRADFRNAVVILTSNLPVGPAVPAVTLGFKAEPPPPLAFDVRAELTRFLRPELVNRIDEILLFRPLDPAALRQIVDRYVKGLESQAPQSLRIELAEEVYDLLIQRGVSEQFGARELRRTVDRYLRQPLAEELLRRGNGAATVRASLDGDRVRFELGPS